MLVSYVLRAGTYVVITPFEQCLKVADRTQNQWPLPGFDSLSVILIGTFWVIGPSCSQLYYSDRSCAWNGI